MAPTAFEKDQLENEVISDDIQYLEEKLLKHEEEALTEIDVNNCIEKAKECEEALRENYLSLKLHAPKDFEVSTLKADYLKNRHRVNEAEVKLRRIKQSFPVASNNENAPPPPPPVQTLRLPTMDVPKFSGNPLEYLTFRDMFYTAVHDQNIPKIEKLNFLKSRVTGEAARLISSIPLTDTNYEVALQALKDRYENKRELLFSTLRRFTTQKSVSPNSASSVRGILDTTKECLRTIEALNINTSQWDPIIVFLIYEKLDSFSRQLWLRSLSDKEPPQLPQLYQFLETHAESLQAGTGPVMKFNSNQRVPTHHTQMVKCKIGCRDSHPLFRCPVFRSKQPEQRRKLIERHGHCYNCLAEGHGVTKCSSSYSCKTCGQRHHTMLHIDVRPPDVSATTATTPQGPDSSSTPVPVLPAVFTQSDGEIETAPLATALVEVSVGETSYRARAFLDPGSASGFVTHRLVQQLNLPLYDSPATMTGLGGSKVANSEHTTTITVSPHFDSSVQYTFTAVVVRKITGNLPFDDIPRDELPYLDGLQLADPAFDKCSPIDLLLGSAFFWDSLTHGKRRGAQNQPVAQNSQFGWLVAGKTWATPIPSFITNVQLDRSLQRFWENEELNNKPVLTKEESLCEEHFQRTHTRDDTGRYHVSIPWKSPRPAIGESRQIALKRFTALERKFSAPHQSEKWKQYRDFMAEYESLGHMEIVPTSEVSQPLNPVYYIPHHCVEKPSSTTTKLRVVFDASATTTSGASLNSAMMVGPVLQDKLMEIMLRFRLHPIAITADVEKMYRQIRVDPPDSDLQRILWRSSPAEQIREYRLTTVTYGTASAPYLAVKCLQQLSKDEGRRFPLASQIALKDFYVDDVATSLPSTTCAIDAVRQLREMFQSGQFQLRKWVTNDPDVLNTIPESDRETKALIPLEHDDAPAVKSLGISWNPKEDMYQFQVNLNSNNSVRSTKRIVLSEIAQIYDPCGWLAPVIISYKIFMQSLWKTNLDWDTPLPEEMQQQWQLLRSSMPHLQQIKIPRCISPGTPFKRSLIGYSDASETAYSAVVYIRSYYDDQGVTTRLLTSKTRVAPVKAVTLPRLELNGPLLLSQLLKSVMSTLCIQFHEVRAYADSTIALSWIQSSPLRWKTYIRNRVNEIQENCPGAIWNHIPGELNPADCASRGITPTELLNHPLWWNGPPHDHHDHHQELPLELTEIQFQSMKSEEKPIKIMSTRCTAVDSIWSRYSSFAQLQRITALLLRFRYNCVSKKFKTPLQFGPLTSFEIRRAHHYIVSSIQEECFPEEYTNLKKNQPLPRKSSLLPLSPFLDDNGVMRVGGRLRHSRLSPNQKHPIIMPRHHHVTSSLIDEAHIRFLHAGPQTLLTILSQTYWIMRGKDAVRFRVKKCTTCARHKATTMTQIMGDLPASRVTPSKPFLKVGVDYAGPFSIRPAVRSKVTLKCWLSIFVCFTTRAIHIEVVSALSTDAFLAAFRRFVSRRGTPVEIYSDCGTNFKGADGVLREFVKISQHPLVTKESASRGITWKFIPPGSPHFGGLWEAGVKSVKHHLLRVMGSATLTFEEMTTLVYQIEAILNSRPLTPASTDPEDLDVLTPAHFLIGCSLTSPPEPSLHDLNINRLDRFQLVQRQREEFWKRWSAEFLTRLQQRPKWFGAMPELKTGAMVLVKEERLPPLKWKLGRVVEVHPGSDGHVRVASVRISDPTNENRFGTKIVKRSICKLSPLPLDI